MPTWTEVDASARAIALGRVSRALLAIVPIVIALAVQRALWDLVAPYTWFLVTPAIFVSTWIVGPRAGVAISAVTSFVTWWLFVPPEGQLGKAAGHLIPTATFFATGLLFVAFHELRRRHGVTTRALRVSRHAREETSRLYQSAQALDQLKTRFFENVSHELRTPLTLVIGPVERLARAAELAEPVRRELQGVAYNARILLRHVNDLLDLAKIEAGRLAPAYADVDVCRFVRRIADPFATLAQEKQIDLVVTAPESMRAEVDPEHVRVVLTNLLSNALKFTPPEGRVRVSLAEAGDTMVLEVADSGPGIPREEREAVFARFYQLERGRLHGGTGLGLAITRELLALRGGRISLGDAPEGGALAHVEMPRRAPSGAIVRTPGELPVDVESDVREHVVDELRTVGAPLEPELDASRAGPLVLVVEDSREMNRFIRESIAPGHRVVAAYDGRDGLEKARTLVPDLLLVDVMMPGMRGDELVRELRRIPSLERTQILVITAKADDALRIRLLREGAQDYLVKPFELEELQARMHNLLATKRMLDAESRVRSLMEQAPDGIFVADLEGRYTDVNAAGCTMLRRTRDEIVGKTIVDLVPPEELGRLAQEREQMMRGRDVVSSWTLRRGDGTSVPVEVSARILPDGRWQGFVRDVSERRRIDQELRESREALERAQAVAQIGSWTLDVRRNELVWSAESYRIFGVPPGTPMTYEKFLATAHPEDRPYVDRMWRAALEGAPYDIEHRVVAGGLVKWVRERAELIFDAEGHVTGGVGTTQDITDRKRIETALRAAEDRAIEAAARIRGLLEASMEVANALAEMPGVSIEAVMGTIAEQARRLVGADFAAIGVGTDPDRPFSPWVQVGVPQLLAARSDRPRPVGALGVVARVGEALRVRDIRALPEFRGFSSDHPRITSFLGVPIRYRGASVGNLFLGNKRGAPEFTEDDQSVVELLAARAGAALETARLYESEALARAWLQSVVDQLPEGTLIVDAEGHITTQNRGLMELFGADTGERDRHGNLIPIDLRQPSGERVGPDELPYVRALERRTPCRGCEYLVRRRDASLMPVLVSASPVLTPDGALGGAVMVVQDVSAMKELERLREEWTSVIAHDLRQPVNVIAMSASLLQASETAPLPPEKRTRAIQSIRSGARALDRMIGDLLDASRIEARRLHVDRRPTSLPQLVREVVGRMPDVEQCCDVEIEPGADRLVLADPGRIEQVLANLLSNALKYGSAGARITLEVKPRDRDVEIVVTNHGAGISAEAMPRLFRRFERTDDVRGRVPGIGLGLYLCKGLVEAHDGRIWAESTPGETTSFHFTLPYAPRREAEVARA